MTNTAWAIRIRARDGSGERLAGKYEYVETPRSLKANKGERLRYRQYDYLEGARPGLYRNRSEARHVAKNIRSTGIHATPVRVVVEVKEVRTA